MPELEAKGPRRMKDGDSMINESNLAARHLLAESWIENVYNCIDGSRVVDEYHLRHGVEALLILTVSSYYGAQAEVQKLLPHIEGKDVVEIGAGVGMLSIQIARYAKRVWAIEADPAWSWVFTNCLYAVKPTNLTWIFGNARDFIGVLRPDVAVVYTRSDVKGMGAIAAQMAPFVVRGPLVEWRERYGQHMTAEQLSYAEEIATEAMLARPEGTRRGLDRATLKDIEQKFIERFGALPEIPA